MIADTHTLTIFQHVTDVLQNAQERPHGPATSGDEKKIAGNACLDLCGGDADKARTMWKLIAKDLGGYLPHAAAVALIRASSPTNLVPDVEAPEVS